jgi:hypothetical protein
VALAFAATAISIVACTSSSPSGDTSPQPAASPTRAAPWGLDATLVPESEAEIDAVLAAMPPEIDGVPGEVQGNEIDYGDRGMGEMAGSMETFLRVMTLGGEEYGTGAAFVGAIVQNGGIDIEAQELGADAPLVYVAGSTPAGGSTYFSVMWAAPDAPYVMLIQATSDAQRLALVRAFQDAAASLG